jgi:hypothetical protein
MADYRPLISRAVAGLEHNTGDNRRVLYERARAALMAQLRGIDPPLDEAELTRERLSLEEAIRQVESEAAAHAPPEVAKPLKPPPAPAPLETYKPSPPAPRPSLRDQGLQNFRGRVTEIRKSLESEASEAGHINRRPKPGSQPSPSAPASGAATHYFEPPAEGVRPAAATGTPAPRGPLPPFEPEPEEQEAYAPRLRLSSQTVKWLLLILVLAAVAGFGYWQRQTISTMVAKLTTSQPATKPPEATVKPKISGRVEPNNAAPANAPAAAVAQKVVLYDEEPNNPQGKRYVGSAIWRTETVSPGQGLAPELAVRADIDIPERHMRMTLSIRRNTDKNLPASHTIEVMFTLPADFDQGSIGNVPGLLMKQSEEARGVPLAGLAVKVTNGYFLIGLSAVDIDLQRNLDFLKNRDWFDIPIVYTSGKRAILALEKGTPGQRAFEEAFRAWGE